jgi:hypothetical protein
LAFLGLKAKPMQFKVPQFLDIEDKIFGPFTFREFAYLAGAAGLCYVFYKWLGLLLGIIPMLLIAGFALLLTFYRPNNKPLIFMLEAGFKYFTQNKLYIWKKNTDKTANKKSQTTNENQNAVNREGGMKLSGSKLRDLAWSLDVLDLSKNKNGNS